MMPGIIIIRIWSSFLDGNHIIKYQFLVIYLHKISVIKSYEKPILYKIKAK